MSAKLAASALAAAAAGTALARSQIVHAAELPQADDLARDSRRKLAIYDAPAAPRELVPVLSPLQDEVKLARETAQHYYGLVQNHAQLATDSWIGWEKDAERKSPSG
ncbi:apolipoprotein O [Pseudohyphozyma bogoriensis]|nr:apolipoprotein O [Pseudohyphozyma bogoriensis]